MKMDSGNQSQTEGIQSTSTYGSVPIEVELSRRYSTQVKNQHGEPAVQMEVQKEPQTLGGRNSLVGVALHKPQCTIHRSVRYDIDEVVSYALITANGVSEVFEEAMESPN